MNKPTVKKDIAKLIDVINEQFASINETTTCSAEQIASFVGTVEQLHKNAVLLEYLNNSTAGIENEKQETPAIQPTETIVAPTPIVPAVIEIIEKEEISIVEIKPTKTKDIKTAIGLNDKFEFINELFKGSNSDYEASIKLLNSSENAESAKKIFYDLQKKYNWQDENESAKSFLEIIKNN